MADKTRILFLCTGNSCRSQMAEGFARARHGDRYEVYSAGIESHGLNPDAVRVMQEVGIDISCQRSKTTDQLDGRPFDYVFTVCDHAHENCPWFPALTQLLHRGFADPPRLAQGATSEEARLAPYRRVRDEIRTWIEYLPQTLELGFRTAAPES